MILQGAAVTFSSRYKRVCNCRRLVLHNLLILESVGEKQEVQFIFVKNTLYWILIQANNKTQLLKIFYCFNFYILIQSHSLQPFYIYLLEIRFISDINFYKTEFYSRFTFPGSINLSINFTK